MSNSLTDLLMHKGWIFENAIHSNLMLACTKQFACLLPANKSLLTAQYSHATQEGDSPSEKDELVDLL